MDREAGGREPTHVFQSVTERSLVEIYIEDLTRLKLRLRYMSTM
jgi:hypothetical protein